MTSHTNANKLKRYNSGFMPATPENYSIPIWNEHKGAQPSHNLASGGRKKSQVSSNDLSRNCSKTF